MISAVVDPSVLVAAFLGQPDAGPSRVVTAWRDGRFSLVISPALLEELGDVLDRPRFAHRAGDGRGRAYIDAFAARSHHQPDPQTIPNVVRDPQDDYLVALALAVKADALISVDKDPWCWRSRVSPSADLSRSWSD